MENMFEIHQMSIPLHILETSDHSYKFLMEMSLKINMETKDVLEKFYQKYITSPDRMYQYTLNPEWGEASGNYRMRFIIVEVDNDYVLIPLKVMDPMGKERYFSISLEPMSYNFSKNSIIKVLLELRNFKCIQFIVLSGDLDKEVYMNNFYNTIEEFMHMDKGKWKSKKGINQLSGIISTQIGYFNEFDIDKVKLIDDMWNEQKRAEKKTTLPAKVDINLTKLCSKSEEMLLYLFHYKDKIIGYAIGTITARKYASILSAKSLTQLSTESLLSYIEESSEDTIKMIQKYLGGYMQYIIHKDILKDRGFEALYYYGDVHSKSLNTFKTIYYKRVINSYKVSIQEYIDLLISNKEE